MKERVDVFLDKYREKMPDHLYEMEAFARENNIPVMERKTADLLRYILKTEKPENVLEIGTAIGYSALFIRECLGDKGHITTVEKIESRYEQAKENFRAHDDTSQITLMQEDAADAIDKLCDEGKQFGVIFLDAAKGQYASYLPGLKKLLTDGGVLIADNIFHNGTVMNSRYAVTQRDRTIHERLRVFLQMLTDDEELESLILPIDDGIAVAKKIR